MMCPAGGSGEAASPGAVLPVQERGPSSSWIKVLAWLQFLLGVTQEWESGSFLPQQQQVGSKWGREPPLGQFTPCHSQCTLSEHIGCVSVSIRNSLSSLESVLQQLLLFVARKHCSYKLLYTPENVFFLNQTTFIS